MMDIFLPEGQVWAGFDADGKCIAASREKAKPKENDSVMSGCAIVLKCRHKRGVKMFGRHVSDFEVVS